MSKKEQTKEQTKEQAQEQAQEQVQEQLQEQQKQPAEKSEGQPEDKRAEAKPQGGKKPAKETDDATARRLMAEHGVSEIHKAGSYWFKKLDDAESWAKQQGCKVESYKR